MNNNNKRYLSDNINTSGDYTPTSTSQACGSVVMSLNSSQTKNSEHNTKTLDNNSDENLTPITQGGQDKCNAVLVMNVLSVYVLGIDTLLVSSA